MLQGHQVHQWNDLGELIQIVVVKGSVGLIVKGLTAWTVEHLRSYVLEKNGPVKVIEPAELSDMFPLISLVEQAL